MTRRRFFASSRLRCSRGVKSTRLKANPGRIGSRTFSRRLPVGVLKKGGRGKYCSGFARTVLALPELPGPGTENGAYAELAPLVSHWLTNKHGAQTAAYLPLRFQLLT